MKMVIPVTEEKTRHPRAGLLVPGEEILLDDELADSLIEAGLCVAKDKDVDHVTSAENNERDLYAQEEEAEGQEE